MGKLSDVVIVAAARSPIGKSFKGGLALTRPDDILIQVLKGVLDRAPGFDPANLEDVAIGCAMPEGEQGLNIGRIAAVGAGLPIEVTGCTINRFCASAMEALHQSAAKLAVGGMGEAFIAGGVESMTRVAMGGFNPSPSPVIKEKTEVYVGMGMTAENLADKYDIPREAQDQFALTSHERAAKAWENGHYDWEVVPIEAVAPGGGTYTFAKDDNIRAGSTLEALAKLKPAFKKGGSVTAANSSPLTDGACAVLVTTAENAEKWGLEPIARIISTAVAGVPPEIMGIGPVPASKKALERAGLTMDDIDFWELNEAFSAQSLAVLEELGLDTDKVNVHGGAIALGHPLGISGVRILITLMGVMKQHGGKYGMATMCVGGGQGAATIIEML